MDRLPYGARYRLIDVQIINHDLIRTLPVKQGEIQLLTSQDILKLAVVERYGKTGGVAWALCRALR